MDGSARLLAALRCLIQIRTRNAGPFNRSGFFTLGLLIRQDTLIILAHFRADKPAPVFATETRRWRRKVGLELQHVAVHLVEGALFVEALHTPARVFRHDPIFG